MTLKESIFGHRNVSSPLAGIERGTSSTRGKCYHVSSVLAPCAHNFFLNSKPSFENSLGPDQLATKAKLSRSIGFSLICSKCMHRAIPGKSVTGGGRQL